MANLVITIMRGTEGPPCNQKLNHLRNTYIGYARVWDQNPGVYPGLRFFEFIQQRSAATQTSLEAILISLRRQYATHLSKSNACTEFYTRKQRTGETLHEGDLRRLARIAFSQHSTEEQEATILQRMLGRH